AIASAWSVPSAARWTIARTRGEGTALHLRPRLGFERSGTRRPLGNLFGIFRDGARRIRRGLAAVQRGAPLHRRQRRTPLRYGASLGLFRKPRRPPFSRPGDRVGVHRSGLSGAGCDPPGGAVPPRARATPPPAQRRLLVLRHVQLQELPAALAQSGDLLAAPRPIHAVVGKRRDRAARSPAWRRSLGPCG